MPLFSLSSLRRRGCIRWVLVAAVLFAAAPGPHAADMPMPGCPMVDGDKPQDLTGLSLDQLFDLDVIPVDVTGTHTPQP